MANNRTAEHSESVSDAEKLGERMRIARRGVRREVFAPRIEVSAAALGNYERGARVADGLVLARICKETGVDPAWLLTGEGEAWPPDPAKMPYDAEKMQLAVYIANALDDAGKLPMGFDASSYATELYEVFTTRSARHR
ncbi:MAG: helix-turn-helix domain-containing protein [Rhodocyclaceae bacterium]